MADAVRNNEKTQEQGTGKSMRESILSVIYSELEKVNHTNIELNEDTDITTDMNVDSVAIMDLIFELEENFDISVPLNELADIRKISELAQLVQSISNAKS